MNSRIREFEKQSSLEIYGLGVKRPQWENALEQFAELIISDVLDILEDSKNFNKCVYTTFDSAQGQCVASELAKKIKEHFGNKQ